MSRGTTPSFHRMPLRVPFALIASCLLASPALANNVQVNLSRVHLSVFPGDLFDVETTTMPGHLLPFYGATLSWYNKELGVQDADTGNRIYRAISNRLQVEQFAGLGITRSMALAIALPASYAFGADKPPARANQRPVDGVYLGDVRIAFKGRFLDPSRAGGLGVGASLELSAPTAYPKGGFNGDRLPTLAVRLILDFLRRGWGFAFNAGFLVRESQPFMYGSSPRLGSQFWIHQAARFPFLCGRIEGVLATDFQTALDSQAFEDFQNVLIVSGGVRSRAGPVTLQGLVGAGTFNGYGSPSVFASFGIGREPLLESGCRSSTPASP